MQSSKALGIHYYAQFSGRDSDEEEGIIHSKGKAWDVAQSACLAC